MEEKEGLSLELRREALEIAAELPIWKVFEGCQIVDVIQNGEVFDPEKVLNLEE